jgi:hypothetical protein
VFIVIYVSLDLLRKVPAKPEQPRQLYRTVTKFRERQPTRELRHRFPGSYPPPRLPQLILPGTARSPRRVVERTGENHDIIEET